MVTNTGSIAAQPRVGFGHVDNVGSFLRPAFLLDAVLAEAAPEQLRELEDRAILEVLRSQEEVGLTPVTDGEFRRRHYVTGILAIIDGFDPKGFVRQHRDEEGKPGSPVYLPTPVRKLSRRASLVQLEYEYLKRNTTAPVKVTLPAPSLLSTYWTDGVSDKAYDSKQAFIEHLATLLNDEAKDLEKAGVAYLQLDAPHYSMIDELVPGVEDRDATLRAMVTADMAVFDGLTDAVTGLHICRGNERSRFLGTDPYESFAEAVFPESRVDRLLVEYDDDRAGDFLALRFVRPETQVVLGLVTTKRPVLERGEDLAARIREATEQIPLERLALSTQCGFASNAEGNRITFADQQAKLDLVMRTARSVWGDPARND